MRRAFSSVPVNLFTYFALLSLAGSALLMLPCFYCAFRPMHYFDALFTTVSALCVTGLCTVDTGQFNTGGLVVLMTLIEAGGLGLITFFTLFLALPAKSLSSSTRRTVRDFFILDVEADPRAIIREIVCYSLALQVVGAVVLAAALCARGERHFVSYGCFLAVSAFCNAGFTPWGDSLHRFASDVPFCTVVMLLAVMGGLGFTVLQDIASCLASRVRRWAYRRYGGRFSRLTNCRRRHLSLHSTVVLFMTAVLVLVPSALFLLTERSGAFAGMALPAQVLNALFQSVTCRTAGFELVDEGAFSAAGTFVSEILMAVGGNPGSMAGGIKTTTVFLAVCSAFRSVSDRGRLSVFHRDIPYGDTAKASAIIIKAMVFMAGIMLVLMLTERAALAAGAFSAGDIVFEAIGAIGSAGMTHGITGRLGAFSRLVLIVAMYGGRTGIIALSLRIRLESQDIKRFIDYPREPILVG